MWIPILQFFLSISILVILHECGHFFPAKWFNTKVEKFYLFFDPYFSLFKVQKGDTEYGIGWLPLGGYVKIAGMIDESFDKEQMAGPPQPWEFRSKPAWQRLIIMIGGVVVNMVLGVFLFAMIFWYWGENYIDNYQLRDGIYVDSIGYDMGLRDGDMILQIGDHNFDKFSSATLKKEIIVNDAKSLIVTRKGSQLEIPIDSKFIEVLTAHENKDYSVIGFRQGAIVDNLQPGSPAEKINLKKGDMISGINGKRLSFIHEISKTIDNRSSDNIELSYIRGGQSFTKSLELKDGKIGVYWSNENVPFKTQEYSFLPACTRGFTRSVDFLTSQLKAFRAMFAGKLKVKDSLGGPVAIVSQFGKEWIWMKFWEMTAMLSLILGFMNFLPIPALDGGHIMFLLWEIITGKKPSDKVVEISTFLGFILLIVLMLFATGNDILRLFR